MCCGRLVMFILMSVRSVSRHTSFGESKVDAESETDTSYQRERVEHYLLQIPTHNTSVKQDVYGICSFDQGLSPSPKMLGFESAFALPEAAYATYFDSLFS